MIYHKGKKIACTVRELNFFCKIMYILPIFNYSNAFSKWILDELRWISKKFWGYIVENVFLTNNIGIICNFGIRGYEVKLQWREKAAIRFYASSGWFLMFSRNLSILYISRLRTTMCNWKRGLWVLPAMCWGEISSF
jgi:hypothetical protein